MSDFQTQVLDQLKDVNSEFEHVRSAGKQNREAIDKLTGTVTDLAAQYQRSVEQSAAEAEALHQKLENFENRAKLYGSGDANSNPDHALHARAMEEYIRYGKGESVDELHQSDYFAKVSKRTLSKGTDTEGGFLVDPQFEDTIIKNVVEISPFRSLARVTQIGTDTLVLKKRTGTPSASWVNESEEPSESSATYGTIRIPVHPLAGNTRVTLDLLQDGPNIEGEIAMDMSEQIAYSEGYAFINGTGVNQPEGILTNADVATPVDTTTGAVTGDGLIQLKYKYLKPAYWNDARYIFNQKTLSTILTLKDSQNNYLWNLANGFSAGAPLLIAGTAWSIMQDMPDEGSNTIPVAIGSWGRAYRIADRLGTVLIRDNVTAKPDVEFMYRKRVGGGVVLAEAIKKLQT